MKINNTYEEERLTKENNTRYEYSEYTKQLEFSLKYFELQRSLVSSSNLQGNVALDIAIGLIQMELDNLRKRVID